MPSDAFTKVTDRLSALASGQSFTLPSDKIDFSSALAALIELLAGEALSLVDASVVKNTSATPATWTVSGTPSKWPIPGIDVLAISTVALTVIDGNDLGYKIDAKSSLAKAHLDTTLSLVPGKDTSNATLAVAAANGLSVGALVGALTIPDLADLVNVADDVLTIADATLLSASISLKRDSDKKTSISGGAIKGALALGPISVDLTVQLPKNASASADIALDWPGPTGPQSCSLSSILSAMHLPFTLPGVLDVTIKSFGLTYDNIALKSQLNSNDTTRLTFVSPKGATHPSVRIVWSRDNAKTWRMVARAGWAELDLTDLPVVGPHLPVKIDPLLLFVISKDLTLSNLKVLGGLAEFPGLESFGLAGDDAKPGASISSGIYSIAILDVTIEGQQIVHEPFQLPLYKFGSSETKGLAFAGSGSTNEPTQADTTTSLPVQKSVGPVHVDNVAFRYDDGTIAIVFNVAISTGGLGLELVGLRVGYSVQNHDLSIDIDGLLLTFAEGAVDISGALVRDAQGGSTDWGGAALVKVADTFALEAVAAFNLDKKSMFMFAYDHQQLGGPPWLIITGIAAGFGYNRAFEVPTVDLIDDFPFVSIANGLARGNPPNGGKPFDIQSLWALMASLEKSLGAADGSDFLTVGITATSFGLANSTALLTIIFGRSVEFVLLGSSSISVPNDSPVAHAEVELVASIQPDAGIIAIDGLLAPGSYVLSESCHLTGGFAYHLWFAGEHAGDFVLTFGGYGPTYHRPSYYPDVPRLAFNWQVSDEVTVTGWSYFALTPSSVQAGGGLSIVLEAGPLSAWCNAQADFFLQWMPFFYEIHLSVDFGVSFRLHMLFCTVTISVDISADLDIWGPDFSGHAEVDLWFVSFGVSFGAGANNAPTTVKWDDFVGALVVPAPTSQSALPAQFATSRVSADASDALAKQPVQIVAVTGLTKASDGADWAADPARTELLIVTTVPAATATLNTKGIATASTISIHAKALDGTPEINPTLTVTIEAADDPDNVLVVNATAEVTQVPSALWAVATQPELIPGLTSVRLFVVVPKPDVLGPVEQSVLLVNTDAAPISIPWPSPPSPPRRTYNWDENGPFKTMRGSAIKDRLASMVSEGYLDQAALDAIDLTFVIPEEPCFMSHPILCGLGAESYQEIAA